MLTQASKKYWAPPQAVMDWLVKTHIPASAKVLEVGPGHAPFRRADMSVDFVDVPGIKMVKCDLANEPLPFGDKEFDFVFCRHTLEDMFNPFPLCREMSRVGKGGYIEMPSPMAELARGVDGGCPPFRGYHHHRFIGWTFGKELRFISKYPFIEYLKFNEDELEKLLEQERYWNTYYLWDDEIRFSHRQSPLDYDIPTQYGPVLAEAVERSKEDTDIFWASLKP